MKTVIHGSPSFAFLDVELAPGESIVSEGGAMSTMSADLDMVARLNGGLLRGFLRKFLGGESLFVNVFTNATTGPRRLTLVQATPGDMRAVELAGNAICLQPGAYVASTPGVKVGVQWAGFKSLIAREGLFRLRVTGTGTLWYGAYGGLVEREVRGEYIVDSSHLVSYDPGLKIQIQLASSLFGSLFSGEGFVTRLEGNGKIMLQTRSLSGLAGWLNPKLH